MLVMKNNFDINDSIEIREVDIAGVACTFIGLYNGICLIILGALLLSQLTIFYGYPSPNFILSSIYSK